MFWTYDRACHRLWLFKRRCHHGGVGCVVMVLGVLLAWHDRKDAREWFALKRLEAKP
jgi:hypothetical protein